MSKYRVAIVAEFESDMAQVDLARWITVSCEPLAGQTLKKLTLTTFELEELDYPDVDLTKI